MNLWKRREKELSHAFDVDGVRGEVEIRDDYIGKATINENTLKISKIKELRGFIIILVRF